ncbi:hypothetical protein [Streptomyces sp. NRRL F-2890]|uniref:hypothetical protein n=1 Tax=Streptomyces sp. NRRL F-2890 TaxID=1463845 RepID=UPI0004CBE5D8|nr:hypothetical protein [Streptomyces sp. NRRL F-2890]
MTAPTPLTWLHVDGFADWAQHASCSMCRTEDVPVIWAGSVIAHGRARGVWACGSCLRTLREFVQDEADSPQAPTRRGTGALRPTAPPASPLRPRALRSATDRAFATITALGVTSLVASVASAWWTAR